MNALPGAGAPIYIPSGPAGGPDRIYRADIAPNHPRMTEGPVKQAIELGRNRLLIAGALCILGFSAIGVRLVDVTLMNQGAEPRLPNTSAAASTRMERADIVDRNGVVLATSLTTASLFADPRDIQDVDGAAKLLVGVMPELNAAEVASKLRLKDRHFVWIRRNLTPKQQVAINRLGIPGLHFQRTERRVYPHGRLTSHFLGYTDVDNKGLAGIEAYFDRELRGGRNPLRLSIDLRVQHILRDELAAAVRRHRAIGASGLIVDVNSGEIVAMASLPDFDPNAPMKVRKEARFNRNTLGVFEMGSTFKIFTTAMALEFGAARLDDLYDTKRPLKVARFTIRDYHPAGRDLSVSEIFVKSSNIGSARLAMDVGVKGHKYFLGELGMLRKAAIELPEIASPLVPARWREINTMTISFGHGLSVSPLQLMSGISAITNGGILRRPTLLAQAPGTARPGKRVISERTSGQMRGLLRRVVAESTGRKAAAPGFRVGGKTGTAEKLLNGRYQNGKLLSSFAGIFPMDNPRYAVHVAIDEPKSADNNRKHNTGGWVAAPVVGSIIRRAGLMLGVKPVLIDENKGAVEKTPLQKARAENTVAGGSRGAEGAAE